MIKKLSNTRTPELLCFKSCVNILNTMRYVFVCNRTEVRVHYCIKMYVYFCGFLLFKIVKLSCSYSYLLSKLKMQSNIICSVLPQNSWQIQFYSQATNKSYKCYNAEHISHNTKITSKPFKIRYL